jgi:hypothetical protein
MPKYTPRACVGIRIRTLMLSLTLAMQSASLFAQQNAAAVSTLAGSAKPAGLAEFISTSLDPLPPAPGYEMLVPRSSIFPATAAPAVTLAAVPVNMPSNMKSKVEESHRFWDRENNLLFAAVGAAATADFFTTHSNLSGGGRELNPITRLFAGNTASLATNFGLETAGVIGLSYFFHKTGHHKLERITSFVNIGNSAGAVTYNLTHR